MIDFLAAFGSVVVIGGLGFLCARFLMDVDAWSAALLVGAGYFVGRGYGVGYSIDDLGKALGGVAALALFWWFRRKQVKMNAYG